MTFVCKEAPFIPKEDLESIKRQALLLTLQSHDYDSRREFVISLCQRTRWLVKTAKRTLARKHRLKMRILDGATLEQVTVEEDHGDRLDHQQICRDLIQCLSDAECNIVELKVYQKRTYREITAVTGLSIYRARRLYKNAIAKMKKVADAKYRNYQI